MDKITKAERILARIAKMDVKRLKHKMYNTTKQYICVLLTLFNERA